MNNSERPFKNVIRAKRIDKLDPPAIGEPTAAAAPQAANDTSPTPEPPAAVDPPPAKDTGAYRFTITLFGNQQALTQGQHQATLPALADVIGQTTSATDKFGLPWLKLSKFGNAKSDKGCLRRNANQQALTGIEVEHDAGLISFDVAVATLRQARIMCLIYTSPSWKADEAEKWRILFPLAAELTIAHETPETYQFSKHEHAKLVARINGLFQGQITDECFVISQAYLFGHLEGADHREEVIEGDCLDCCDNLDATAIFKTTATPPTPAQVRVKSNDDGLSTLKLPAKVERLLTASCQRNADGKGQWHNSMLEATAVMVGGGWSDDDIFKATAPYALAGYGDGDVEELVDDARRKWKKVDPGRVFDERLGKNLEAMAALHGGNTKPGIFGKPGVNALHDDGKIFGWDAGTIRFRRHAAGCSAPPSAAGSPARCSATAASARPRCATRRCWRRRPRAR